MQESEHDLDSNSLSIIQNIWSHSFQGNFSPHFIFSPLSLLTLANVRLGEFFLLLYGTLTKHNCLLGMFACVRGPKNTWGKYNLVYSIDYHCINL